MAYQWKARDKTTPGANYWTDVAVALLLNEQYVADAAAVEAVKAGVRTTVTVLGVTGTLDLDLYTLTATLVAALDAAKADILTSRTLYTVTGTFDATNLSVGNVIQGVTFGVGLTGTGANLLATHTTYLSLEAGRNSMTAAAAQILMTYSVTIAGSTTNGTYVPIAQANARLTGAGYYGAGGAVDGTCYVPGAADVRKTVNVDATTGTLVGIVDSTGTLHAYGCCSNTQARTATGIVHDAGTVSTYGIYSATNAYQVSGILDGSSDYSTLDCATEAAGGTYHEAAVGEVKNLVAFGAASALTGTYSPGGTFAEGQANQLATDIAEVETHLADIRKTIVVLTGADAGTLVVFGEASGSLTLAKETGANAYGGSGDCAKLTPTSAAAYGYWDFLVYVTGNACKLSFRYKSFKDTGDAFNGTVKVSWWDMDDHLESPPPLLNGSDIGGTYDDTYRLYESAAKTPSGEGLCRVRIEIIDGAQSGGIYVDDIMVTDT